LATELLVQGLQILLFLATHLYDLLVEAFSLGLLLRKEALQYGQSPQLCSRASCRRATAKAATRGGR